MNAFAKARRLLAATLLLAASGWSVAQTPAAAGATA